MIVSKEIQKDMHKLASMTKEVEKLSRKIDKYFRDKGYDTEKLHCDNGISLDELLYGNDITDEFCKHARDNFSDTDLWYDEYENSNKILL